MPHRQPLSEPRSDPFGLLANPSSYVPRPATETALQELERAVLLADAPVALAGPPGIGKTLLLRVLATRVAETLRSVHLPYPRLEADDLFHWALRELGIGPVEDPQAALLDAAHPHGDDDLGLLLVVDDADALPPKSAESLFALNRRSDGELRLVLAVSDPERREQLVADSGGELVVVTLDEPMSAAETAAYVRARIAELEKQDPELRRRFHPEALAWVHRESEGHPVSVHVAAEALLLSEPQTPPTPAPETEVFPAPPAGPAPAEDRKAGARPARKPGRPPHPARQVFPDRTVDELPGRRERGRSPSLTTCVVALGAAVAAGVVCGLAIHHAERLGLAELATLPSLPTLETLADTLPDGLLPPAWEAALGEPEPQAAPLGASRTPPVAVGPRAGDAPVETGPVGPGRPAGSAGPAVDAGREPATRPSAEAAAGSTSEAELADAAPGAPAEPLPTPPAPAVPTPAAAAPAPAAQPAPPSAPASPAAPTLPPAVGAAPPAKAAPPARTRPRAGSIPVRVEVPEGALLEVDGRLVSHGSVDALSLRPGAHRFVARLPDGTAMQRTVVVSPERDEIVFR